MTTGPSIVFSFWNDAVIINMTLRMMTAVAVEKADTKMDVQCLHVYYNLVKEKESWIKACLVANRSSYCLSFVLKLYLD